MRHRSTIPRQTGRQPLVRAHRRRPLVDVLRAARPRLLIGVLVTVGITALLLAVPVVAGKVANPAPAALTSSAAAARASTGSPVVMGEDGLPLPASAGSGGTGTRMTGPDSAAAAGTAASSSRSGSTGAPLSAAPTAGTSTTRTTSPRSATHSPTAGGKSSSASGSPGSSSASSTGTSAPDTPTVAAPAPGRVPGDAAEQMLALVNAERATAGCDDLAIDSALTTTAAADSAAMRAGSLSDPAVAAVAQGATDPAAVVGGWLSDATDRGALLDCTRTEAGLGIDTGTGGPWWVLVLG